MLNEILVRPTVQVGWTTRRIRTITEGIGLCQREGGAIEVVRRATA
jgi:hypothetical protein